MIPIEVYIVKYILYFSILAATVTMMSRCLKITPTLHKYPTLDGARGICATLVLMFHLFLKEGGGGGQYPCFS